MAQRVKSLPVVQETWVWSLGWEDLLEEEMATHSSILAWKISWKEEPGTLQSMGWRRVGHNWETSLSFLRNPYLCSIILVPSILLQWVVLTLFKTQMPEGDEEYLLSSEKCTDEHTSFCIKDQESVGKPESQVINACCFHWEIYIYIMYACKHNIFIYNLGIYIYTHIF